MEDEESGDSTIEEYDDDGAMFEMMILRIHPSECRALEDGKRTLPKKVLSVMY